MIYIYIYYSRFNAMTTTHELVLLKRHKFVMVTRSWRSALTPCVRGTHYHYNSDMRAFWTPESEHQNAHTRIQNSFQVAASGIKPYVNNYTYIYIYLYI